MTNFITRAGRQHYRHPDLSRRGWTEPMIRRLLGQPDDHRWNHYGTWTRLYLAERVCAVEATEAFVAEVAAVERRRAAVKPAREIDVLRAIWG